MIIPSATTRILVKTQSDRKQLQQLAAANAAFNLEINAVDDAPVSWSTAYLSEQNEAVHPWDLAHEYVQQNATNSIIEFAEPDLLQQFAYTQSLDIRAQGCIAKTYNDDWPVPQDFAWHLGDKYSQLAAARAEVGVPASGQRVRIGHLDTGYSNHISKPPFLLTERGKDFVGGSADARDPAEAIPFANPGHGTATLAILAGGQITHQNFHGVIGGAPEAEVIPIRIANSVVHFSTSAMADGIRYAVDQGCDVITISMGGVAARSWADAVNYAYEKGVAIFAAAGNNIGGLPTHYVVSPAKFKRVTAVTGATSELSPYWKSDAFKGMQGCWGPDHLMKYAIAAYTPNIPWAVIGCDKIFDFDGAGTSCATPQVAAAAALWIQKHRVQLSGLYPWQKVEAVRTALFETAQARSDYFGHGLLRAKDALAIGVDKSKYQKADKAEVKFKLFNELFGLSHKLPDVQLSMLQVEAVQLLDQSAELAEIYDGANPATDLPEKKSKIMRVLAESPNASKSMRTFASETAAKV